MTGPELIIPEWWPHALMLIGCIAIGAVATYVAPLHLAPATTQNEKTVAEAHFFFGFVTGAAAAGVLALMVTWPL